MKRKKSIYISNEEAYENVIRHMKSIYDRLDDELERKLVTESIKMILRKKTEYEAPKFVSVELNELLINSNKTIEKHGDIHEINKRITPIIVDHCNPISDLVDRYVKNEISNKKLIEENYTCGITKEEDNRLNSKHLKSRRVDGWHQAYKECGIDFLKYISTHN